MRLAAYRFGLVATDLRKIGQLSGVNYDFKAEDIAELRRALHQAVDDALGAFDRRLHISKPVQLSFGGKTVEVPKAAGMED